MKAAGSLDSFRPRTSTSEPHWTPSSTPSSPDHKPDYIISVVYIEAWDFWLIFLYSFLCWSTLTWNVMFVLFSIVLITVSFLVIILPKIKNTGVDCHYLQANISCKGLSEIIFKVKVLSTGKHSGKKQWTGWWVNVRAGSWATYRMALALYLIVIVEKTSPPGSWGSKKT